MPTGDQTRNPGMCPDWESNLQPFGAPADTPTAKSHPPGPACFFSNVKNGLRLERDYSLVRKPGRFLPFCYRECRRPDSSHSRAEAWTELGTQAPGSIPTSLGRPELGAAGSPDPWAMRPLPDVPRELRRKGQAWVLPMPHANGTADGGCSQLHEATGKSAH